MICELNIEYKVDKAKIFNKLHIDENTEVYKNADSVFLELYEIINKYMKLTVLYSIVDSLHLSYKELDKFEKYALCLVSSRDGLSIVINNMMSSGDYLKGYLLNEMATDYIFSASNEMNKIIRKRANSLGYKLSKRFAPGDEGFELKNQKYIIDLLKEEVAIDVYLTDNYVIVPEKSLLYLFGLEQDINGGFDSVLEYGCKTCSNINCEYREKNNEKI